MADTTTPDTEDNDAFERPFLDVLRELDKGRLADELTAMLPRLVAAVKDTGKAGALTFTLKIKPYAKGDDILVVDTAVSLKAPVPDRKPSLMYADKNANLVRQDPNQMSLPGVGNGGPRVIQGGQSRNTGS